MSVASFIVYGLCDPRDGQLRYVGKSTSGMRRVGQHWKPWHIAHDSNIRKARWLSSLRSKGLKPDAIVLEARDTTDGLYEAEQFHIAYFRMVGAELLNLSDGGPGTQGCRWSDVTKAKISRSRGGGPIHNQYGEVFMSQQAAAVRLGLRQSDISRQIRGLRRSVGGHVFARQNSEVI